MLGARKLFSLLALACAAAFMISGCGNGNGNNVNPNTVISVVVYPGTGNAKAAPNGTINFTATVYNFTANGGVTWKAASGTITTSTANTATYQAPAMGSSDTVTATSVEDPTKSFSVTVNITATQAITISPVSVSVLAGATQQFRATGGGGAVTWSLPPPGPGQNFGTIDPTGLYTAPPSPPPGGIVVITATFGASNGTASVTILYSNASLCKQCKYVFSYSGEDATNGFFLASAGNLLTDGSGNIVGDGHSFVDLNEGAGDIMANVTGGNYTIGPDGRGTINVITSQGTFILQVSVISPQQALVVRFDTMATGSGTMDLANVADFSGIADGNYAFGVSGVDSGGFSMVIAGRFLSSGGTFPLNDAIQDANDAGKVTQADTSLHGNVVSFVDPASGRGTLEFQSTAVKPSTLTFAFYIVDDTHFKLVEIDQTPVLAGDAFSAPAIITDASLQASNYAFTLGGSSTGGPFAAGGIFKSSGTGTIGGGDLDTVVNGAPRAASISSTSTYSVTPLNSNRILMSMITGNTTLQFGVYPTTNGTAEMVEVDTFFVSGGLASAQSSTTTPQGSFSFNLSGVSGNLEQDYVGTIATTGANNWGGYLDVNVTGSIFGNTPLATNSTINAPDSFGRGTTTLLTTPPTSATIGLTYYTISKSQALVLEVDGSATTLGVLVKQF